MATDHNATLKAFSEQEFDRAKVYLATQVAHMMGRKLEEDDWNKVYCAAKNIPYSGWSNLNIDVNYRGLGVEQKLRRCSGLNGRSIRIACGTTLLHPAATRSIRIDDITRPVADVMRNVLSQYAELIKLRRETVREKFPEVEPDLRTGWLIWEDSLTEFLYFENRLEEPKSENYYATWNETRAKGARKASKSLWIFEKSTNKKRYSVTTSAGIKIQPYLDVPSPSDPNLYFFRVQSEILDDGRVQIWVSASTARDIRRVVGDLDTDRVSEAIKIAASFEAELGQNARKGGRGCTADSDYSGGVRDFPTQMGRCKQ